jgi:hypothetical protein
MYKKALSLTFFLFVAAAAFAQDSGSDKRVSILGKPFIYLGASYVNGLFSLASMGVSAEAFFLPLDVELYFKLSDNLNLFLNPNVWLLGTSSSDNLFYTVNMIAGIVWRPGGGGLTGFYCMFNGIAGWSQYSYLNREYDYTATLEDEYSSYPYTDTPVKLTYFNIGAMVEAGYTWIFNKGFTLMLGGGFVGVFPVSLDNDGASFFPMGLYIYGIPGWPVQTRMRVSIGYSF